jgi:hypothetical protein
MYPHAAGDLVPRASVGSVRHEPIVSCLWAYKYVILRS